MRETNTRRASAKANAIQENAEAVTIKGRVERIFYTSEDFTAGVLAPDEKGPSVSFAGSLAVNVSDRIVLHGVWTEHEKFGRQVKVTRFEFNQSLADFDARGLAAYLASHPDFRGIGPVKAKVLAEAFGTDFGRVLEEEPEKIVEVSGILASSVTTFREKWIKTKDLNESMTWLAGFDLTRYQTKALIEEFGNSVSTILRRDPYIIVQKVKGFGFKRADEIARKMGVACDDPNRLEAALINALETKLDRDGDCFVEHDALIALTDKLLSVDSESSTPPRQIELAIKRLLEDEDVTSIEFAGGGDEVETLTGLGLTKTFECESFLKGFFAEAADSKNNRLAALSLASGDPDGVLQGLQVEALAASRESACVLITGGAGSGKTFTIAAIVRMYLAAGLNIALAAPTGKAARRIEEVADHPALTIHRLLEYGVGGKSAFARNEGNPIEADVLIVDEVSMLDVYLAESLFRAVSLGRTAIVLVGDPNQLPPVGPGNVLRDLLQRRLARTVKLDKIIRQAGLLRENSARILKGEIAASAPETEDGTHPWTLARSSTFKDGLRAHRYILGLFEKTLHEKLGFDLLNDVQVLTPKHQGPLGTRALNFAIQALVQKKLWGVTVAPQNPERRAKLYVQDRVIQTRNDYDSGIMNGTVGNVVGVAADEKSVTVDFDGEEVQYDRKTMQDLDLAYALTIHKSQGSEFPCVVLVIQSEHVFMHHRNLFYTGVTRARKSVVIVGDPEGMARCVKRGEIDRRRTFLSVLP